MIAGVHAMFYSSDAAATRGFLRDKLKLPFSDVGEGWLIFDLPSGDLGVHPADPAEGALPGTPHVSFFCDDVKQTVAELKARGVDFKGEIEDHGYGLVTHFKMPGGIEAQLYQPRYVKKKQAKKKSSPRKTSKPRRKTRR